MVHKGDRKMTRYKWLLLAFAFLIYPVIFLGSPEVIQAFSVALVVALIPVMWEVLYTGPRLNAAWWRAVSWFVRRPAVRDWIVSRVYASPYTHIGPHGDEYMLRGWVFNPYRFDKTPRWPWLPSLRAHVILRPDAGESCHNHPMDARTILLKNGYAEWREGDCSGLPAGETRGTFYLREEGDTFLIGREVFHRIMSLRNNEPVYTLFIIRNVRHGWGFRVNGEYVDRRNFKGPR